MNHTVNIQNVSKTYGDFYALRDVSLELKPGEIVALTGPSGAGKTTLSRIITGLEHATSGQINIDGNNITKLAPYERDIALMFESYALYPHMSVFENIAFPLNAPKRRGSYTAADISSRIHDVSGIVGMTQYLYRKPSELSGGQKQRVALCRTLVQEANAYILDEPISHLDAKLRHRLRREIVDLLRERNKPVMWITPDSNEALSVADKIVVIDDGHIQQTGTPKDVYDTPVNLNIATLIGDPSMNILRVQVTMDNDHLHFTNDNLKIKIPVSYQYHSYTKSLIGQELLIGIHAQYIDGPDNDSANVSGSVELVEPFGRYTIVTVNLGNQQLRLKTDGNRTYHIDQSVKLRLDPQYIKLFDKDTGLLQSHDSIMSRNNQNVQVRDEAIL